MENNIFDLRSCKIFSISMLVINETLMNFKKIGQLLIYEINSTNDN